MQYGAGFFSVHLTLWMMMGGAVDPLLCAEVFAANNKAWQIK
jgi:hypothetical protein